MDSKQGPNQPPYGGQAASSEGNIPQEDVTEKPQSPRPLLPAPTKEGQEPLQVDDDYLSDHRTEEGGDSIYDETEANYAGSAASSIYEFQYENGRRYHAYREGHYMFPNDSEEQERLDLHHHIWRLLLGGRLYTIPQSFLEETNSELRILDLGTGTGIWAMELADELPEAVVFGVDLSPIQPQWVPPNCRFFVDDYNDEWAYDESEAFDYIHGRALNGTTEDWPQFYSQVKANLKPGGWLEMQEFDAWIYSDDDSYERAPWTREWTEKLIEASRRFGKYINVAKHHKQWMIDAGFEDVHEEIHRVPIGPWAKDPALKELGNYELIHMHMSVDSHTPALLTRMWNYSQQQTSVLMEGVKREFRDKNYRFMTCYRFIRGRKPQM